MGTGPGSRGACLPRWHAYTGVLALAWPQLLADGHPRRQEVMGDLDGALGVWFRFLLAQHQLLWVHLGSQPPMGVLLSVFLSQKNKYIK